MNLVRMLLDPIAIKELSGSARRWQTYVGRGIYVAVFALILWNYSERMSGHRQWISRSFYAELGRELFKSFFALQMFVVTLGAVSAGSDQVSKEVRAGTLSILACSPLTPWRIALGKWKAAMAQTSTLLICSAPIVAFCVYLGGPTGWDLTYSIAISVACAALGAATAIYCSTRFRSGVTALLVSCGALAVYAFLPASYLDYTHYSSLPEVLTRHLHLVDAASAMVSPRRSSRDFEWAWVSAVLVTGIFVWVLLRRAAARIATLVLVTPGPPLLSRVFATLDRFYETLGPRRLRGIRLLSGRDEVWETRAVLWKELHTRASGRLRNSVRISLLLLLVLAASLWISLHDMTVPVAVTALILWLLALSNGASLFVTEKEERKWDILLATPLTAAQILGAKLLAGIVPVLPTACTVLLFWAAISYTHRLDGSDLFVAAVDILVPAALAYVLGALCSLKARSLRGAFITAFSLLTLLVVVLPWLKAYRTEYRSEDSGGYSPLAQLLWISERSLSSYYRHPSDGLISNTVILCLLYTTVIVSILAYLYARFDRISGRSDGGSR